MDKYSRQEKMKFKPLSKKEISFLKRKQHNKNQKIEASEIRFVKNKIDEKIALKNLFLDEKEIIRLKKLKFKK